MGEFDVCSTEVNKTWKLFEHGTERKKRFKNGLKVPDSEFKLHVYNIPE
jgi:hypothetical protein